MLFGWQQLIDHNVFEDPLMVHPVSMEYKLHKPTSSKWYQGILRKCSWKYIQVLGLVRFKYKNNIVFATERDIWFYNLL